MDNQSQIPVMTLSQSALATAEDALDDIEGIFVYSYF